MSHQASGIAAAAARPVPQRHVSTSWTETFTEAAEQIMRDARSGDFLLGCLILDTGPHHRMLPAGTSAALAAAAAAFGDDTAIHVRNGMTAATATILVADTYDNLTARLDGVSTVLAVATQIPAGSRLVAGRGARGSKLRLRARATIDTTNCLNWAALVARVARDSTST